MSKQIMNTFCVYRKVCTCTMLPGTGTVLVMPGVTVAKTFVWTPKQEEMRSGYISFVPVHTVQVEYIR